LSCILHRHELQSKDLTIVASHNKKELTYLTTIL
jgi:hypothetical protein